MGIRGLLVYCSDYQCSDNVEISADRWPDLVRLSDIEDRLVCTACGKRGLNAYASPKVCPGITLWTAPIRSLWLGRLQAPGKRLLGFPARLWFVRLSP